LDCSAHVMPRALVSQAVSFTCCTLPQDASEVGRLKCRVLTSNGFQINGLLQNRMEILEQLVYIYL
jgi:hypothetical protein